MPASLDIATHSAAGAARMLARMRRRLHGAAPLALLSLVTAALFSPAQSFTRPDTAHAYCGGETVAGSGSWALTRFAAQRGSGSIFGASGALAGVAHCGPFPVAGANAYLDGCVSLRTPRGRDSGCGDLSVVIDHALALATIVGSVPSERFRGRLIDVDVRILGAGRYESCSGGLLICAKRKGNAFGRVRSGAVGRLAFTRQPATLRRATGADA